RNREDGRAGRARREHHAWLLEQHGGDKERISEWLLSHGRCRLSGRKRVLLYSRSIERYDRHRRRERLLLPGGSRHLHASGGSRRSSLWITGSKMGRTRDGLRCFEAGKDPERG